MASQSKRVSTAGQVPVALPKNDVAAQAAPTVPHEAALHAAVGSRVRISTAPPNQSTVEGTIYVADPTTNLLVVNVAPAQNAAISASTLEAPAGSYRIIPVSQISSFQLQALPSSQSPATANSPQNTLDTAALQSRLNREISKLQSAHSRQGPKGTTPSDQALFDNFSRTMPTVWHGNAMIVSETFIIEKPYTQANVKLIGGASGDIDRMKRVLEMEKSKIALRMGKDQIDNRFGETPKATGKKGG